MKERLKHDYARGILVCISLLCSLTLSAQDVYLWATANGTHFYLKVEDPVKLTAQIHENQQNTYTGDIIIPEKIMADNGKEYTITLIDQQAF